MKRLYALPALLPIILFGACIVPAVSQASTTAVLVPTSDGNYTQWTPSTGTTHFTLVDESACNGTTDYNSTATNGNRDSYGVGISSVGNGAIVSQVAVVPCASLNSSGGGSSVLNVFYRW